MWVCFFAVVSENGFLFKVPDCFSQKVRRREVSESGEFACRFSSFSGKGSAETSGECRKANKGREQELFRTLPKCARKVGFVPRNFLFLPRTAGLASGRGVERPRIPTRNFRRRFCLAGFLPLYFPSEGYRICVFVYCRVLSTSKARRMTLSIS